MVLPPDERLLRTNRLQTGGPRPSPTGMVKIADHSFTIQTVRQTPIWNSHLCLLFLIPNTLTGARTWEFPAAGSRRSPTRTKIGALEPWRLYSPSIHRAEPAGFASHYPCRNPFPQTPIKKSPYKRFPLTNPLYLPQKVLKGLGGSGECECRSATSPNWRWRQFFFQKFPLARPFASLRVPRTPRVPPMPNITKKSPNFHRLFCTKTPLFIICLQLYVILS